MAVTPFDPPYSTIPRYSKLLNFNFCYGFDDYNWNTWTQVLINYGEMFVQMAKKSVNGRKGASFSVLELGDRIAFLRNYGNALEQKCHYCWRCLYLLFL